MSEFHLLPTSILKLNIRFLHIILRPLVEKDKVHINTMAMINGNENAVNLQQSRGSSHKYPTLQNFLLNIKHKDACSQSKFLIELIEHYYISVQAAAMQARNYQSRQKIKTYTAWHIKRYVFPDNFCE
ncbi:hypothetical protein T03_13054 [Trichinella britovi]|uniref:Uncharacterized protein n=2 Tax=Trichinella TaxID=6333 RepID=A0A0V1CWU0_TRIBR|nr:hypothetical protein T05_15963 [Trichinella murrelli]KRY53550.1 hypothetical protein T03_13054 [Trichinella britovi]